MPRDINGVYTLPEVPFVPGVIIRSALVNSDLSDIAINLTQSLATTGVSVMTGPVRTISGSLSAPGITWGASLGTGFFRSNPNEIGITVNGVLLATLKSDRTVSWTNSATWVGNGTFTGVINCDAYSGIVSGTLAGHPITNFPIGTQKLFQQATAPIGWTRNVSSSIENRALRVNALTTIGSGGFFGFTTIFVNTATGVTVADLPSHNHTFTYDTVGLAVTPIITAVFSIAQTVSPSPIGVTASFVGNTGSHNHTVETRVTYLDFMLAFRS